MSSTKRSGEVKAAKDPNMTDTNGAAGVMDEDGELDTKDDGAVNEAPEGNEDEDEDAAPKKKKTGKKAEADTSPLLHGLAVKVDHLHGMEKAQTTIVATVHTDMGIHSKRMVITGEVTVQRLAAILQGVADW